LSIPNGERLFPNGCDIVAEVQDAQPVPLKGRLELSPSGMHELKPAGERLASYSDAANGWRFNQSCHLVKFDNQSRDLVNSV
jgi:hypothetical protein